MSVLSLKVMVEICGHTAFGGTPQRRGHSRCSVNKNGTPGYFIVSIKKPRRGGPLLSRHLLHHRPSVTMAPTEKGLRTWGPTRQMLPCPSLLLLQEWHLNSCSTYSNSKTFHKVQNQNYPHISNGKRQIQMESSGPGVRQTKQNASIKGRLGGSAG